MVSALLLLVLPLLPAGSDGKGSAHAALAASQQPTGVRAAFALCRSSPTARRLWLRGWFIPTRTGTVDDGLLFDSPAAVPLTTVSQPDIDGHWTYYGALFAHIRTRASFGPRELILHGRLDCRSAQFWTDRDPVPPPALATTYIAPHAANDGSIATSATAGGLRLTLTVPQRSYPRNALALVSVSMRNVSRHAIGYYGGGITVPGYGVPQVQVLDSSGRIVFPPAMPYVPPLPGPAPSLQILQPGQAIAGRRYIVVRGARIRLSQPFTLQTQPQPAVSFPLSTLTTRPITVALTSEPAPTLSLYNSGGSLNADVTALPGMTGRPLHLSYTDCGFPSFDYTPEWRSSELRLAPGCSPVQAWHLRVGWLGHPVAALDYTAPVPTPATTPTPSPTAAPTSTPTPTTAFTEILRRANSAMSAVHTLHASGIHQVFDTSPRLALTVQADCRSGSGTGLPITLRTIRSGGSPGTEDGYLISGPMIPWPGSTTRTWWRTPGTGARWRIVDLRKQWKVAQGIGDPVFGPNPAYTNQVCPDLIRLTYLAAPLASITVLPRVLGMTTLNGHRVWHLREQLYFKLDLFIDASSYRLLRLRLWDGVAPGNRWQVRFDYSRFNAPVRFALLR